jgi:flagellar biosynthesis/type III secretory pathway chaperone
MIESLKTLISALRGELQEYGEMLALLDRQQQLVMARAADEVFQSISLIQAQGVTIQAARGHREDCRARVAAELSQDENITFALLMPQLPADYRPLVGALVEENNHLLVRVQQRARQNHLLLSRSLEMMQDFLNTLMPGREIRVYNDHGNMHTHAITARPLYEAVG